MARRVTNVPLTSINSGAGLLDLVTLPPSLFVIFQVLRSILRHWQITLMVLLTVLFNQPLILLTSLILSPIGFMVWIYGAQSKSIRAELRKRGVWPLLQTLARMAVLLVGARSRWGRALSTAGLETPPQGPKLFSYTCPPRLNLQNESITFRLKFYRSSKPRTDFDSPGVQELILTNLRALSAEIDIINPGECYYTVQWRHIPKPTDITPSPEVTRTPELEEVQQYKVNLWREGDGPEEDATKEFEIDPSVKTQLPEIPIDDSQQIPVTLELDTSILIVGESGSGKSNLTWSLLNGLNTNAVPYKLTVIDPKQVELAELEDSPRTIKYIDQVRDAERAIEEFRNEMQARLSFMKTKKLRKINISKAYPLNILIIDEFLLLSRALKGGATDTPFGEILAVGRAAGYVIWGNSQLSQVDVLGRIRDLFPQRVCLATKSQDVTNAVLGPRAEQRGAKCSQITQPGQGYIFSDTYMNKGFRRFQVPLIPDEKVIEIAHPPI